MTKNETISRKQLVAKVAWMYYQEDQTQADIAEKLGLSRVTINRLLKEARDSGIVEIKVHTGFSNTFELSRRLCAQYSLLDAMVISPGSTEEDLQSLLAEGAAHILMQRIQPGVTIGIGTGRTISFLPDHTPSDHQTVCRFVSLTGGLDMQQNGVPHTYDTITRLAIQTGGEAHYIPAPSYLTDPAAHDVFMQQTAVLVALKAAASSQIAFFSVGATDYSAILFRLRYLNENDMAELKAKKAVGDVLGRFYDVHGQQLPLTLNKRTIGLKIEELKQIPVRVLVAGGPNKEQAMRVALNHQFCNILVTDEDTAERLQNPS